MPFKMEQTRASRKKNKSVDITGISLHNMLVKSTCFMVHSLKGHMEREQGRKRVSSGSLGHKPLDI